MARNAAVRNAGEGGFTLLEVLVAFIIAALALGVLVQGAMGGMESARASGEYSEALSRARSHLAAIGAGGAVVAGTQQGDDGHGFTWRSVVQPIGTAPLAHGNAVDQARGPRAILYAVTVAVSWPGERGTRSVQLTSRRVGPAPPPPP